MLTFPPDYPELLQTLASVIYDGLTQRGMPDDQATELALGAADEVRTVFGGHSVYITRGAWMTSQRNLEIWKAYKGPENEDRLARQYNLTVRSIQIIAKRVGDELRAERQAALPL